MFLRSTRIVALLSVALLSAPDLAAQDVRTPVPEPGEGARAPDASAPLVFEGFVLEPSGAPAQGAVVVTSAGGKALTDTLGRYRLEARVPLDAGSVQVTAVSAAGRNRVASARVELPAASHSTRVAPLLLTEEAACAQRWLPTFGEGTDGIVRALTVYDDGGGAALYAAGEFTMAGVVAASNIAKWDGSSWSSLGGGMDGPVIALAVYDDGGGAALYAAGAFTAAGGVAANRIARWDGSSWSPLGAGTGKLFPTAMAAYDDGGGAALYVSADDATPTGSRMAKWNGSRWKPLAGGYPDGDVYSLTVYDDGGGPALYAGGVFTTAGVVAASNIAKWDGSSWSALGSGTSNRVRALTVYDDGAGAALYAGGRFTGAGGVVANRIARWDGSSWSALGGGMSGNVHALAVHDDGSAPALYAGGAFASALDSGDSYLAKWGCPAPRNGVPTITDVTPLPQPGAGGIRK